MTAMRPGRRSAAVRHLLFYPVSILIGFLLGVLLLEIVFQVLPVGNAVLEVEVDERYRIKRFEPRTTVQWSAGWDFALRTRKRSNGLGFLDDHDCARDTGMPTLAIIGDSYVEAMQVSNAAALHGRLQQGIEGQGQVCGIGSSGSALSNYLVYAELARDRLAPQLMAFVIVGNDFDEAMCRYYNQGVGMWCYQERPGADPVLVPKPSAGNRLRELARYSALLRYVAFNLRIDWRQVLARLAPVPAARADFVGNVPAEVDADRLHAARAAVTLFLDALPARSGLAPDKLLFVVDGIRQDVYAGDDAGEGSYFGQMRRTFIAAARERGHEVVDMHAVFAADFSRNRERFEFPIDGHWNALGHHLAAGAIAGSQGFAATFGRSGIDLARPDPSKP